MVRCMRLRVYAQTQWLHCTARSRIPAPKYAPCNKLSRVHNDLNSINSDVHVQYQSVGTDTVEISGFILLLTRCVVTSQFDVLDRDTYDVAWIFMNLKVKFSISLFCSARVPRSCIFSISMPGSLLAWRSLSAINSFKSRIVFKFLSCWFGLIVSASGPRICDQFNRFGKGHVRPTCPLRI